MKIFIKDSAHAPVLKTPAVIFLNKKFSKMLNFFFFKSSKCPISVKKTHTFYKKEILLKIAKLEPDILLIWCHLCCSHTFIFHTKDLGEADLFLQNWTMICPKIFVQMQFVKETVESWQVADIVQKLSTFCFLIPSVQQMYPFKGKDVHSYLEEFKNWNKRINGHKSIAMHCCHKER